jgi:hypothetical protein
MAEGKTPEEKLRILELALTFYASEDNWTGKLDTTGRSAIESDRGNVARDALKEVGSVEP